MSFAASTFRNINFEIVSFCNARCFYCPTGKKNLLGESYQKKFIKPELFEKAIAYMLDKQIINKNTNINLFNKGEPLLHPRIKNIIDILNTYDLKFCISTNASNKVLFDGDNVLRNLQSLYFSMPGFDEQSYKRQHGFDFNKIQENIREILNNWRNSGFNGSAYISYHLYKYTHQHLHLADKFAKELNASVNEYPAYMIDQFTFMDYIDGKMDNIETERAINDLFFLDKDSFDKITSSSPKDRYCEFWDLLVLDCNANVLTCCAADPYKNITLGSLFNFSPDSLWIIKRKAPICKKCKEYKLDYFYSVINKYNSSMINDFYHGKIITYIPNKNSVKHYYKNFIIYLYLYLLGKFKNLNYFLNVISSPQSIYKKLIK